MMMNDFYKAENPKITGEQFSNIIIQFIDKIKNFDNAD